MNRLAGHSITGQLAALLTPIVLGSIPIVAQADAPAPAPVSSPSAVAAPDPERLALAREVLSLGFPEAKREELFFGAMDAMLKQMRSVMFTQMQNDPGVVAIANRKIDSFVGTGKQVLRKHIPALMEGWAQGYAREFSRNELLEYRAFAATSGGQHFLLRSSAILADPSFAAANEGYMRELQPMMEKCAKS